MTPTPDTHTADYSVRTMWMRTTDGEDLRTDVSIPTNDANYPVVLIRTPYSEPMQRGIPTKPLVEAGFVVAVQYCRGAFGSTGTLFAFEDETRDGLEALDWVRSQPWCDGRIVMMGQSYLGMTQNAVAWKQPKGLLAMVQTVTTHNYRDGLVYQQGALQLGQGLGWHQLKTVQTLQDRAASGKDVQEDFARFGTLTCDSQELYNALPLVDRGIISETLPSWKRWIEGEAKPDYWSAFSFAGKQHLTAAPALHIGGWYDLFLRGTLGNFTAMTSAEAEPEVRRKQRLVIGPWTHTDRSGSVGLRSFPSGSENAIGLEKLQIDYLRQVINGEEPSMPPVLVYVMGANRWQTSESWPLPSTKFQAWTLGGDGGFAPVEADSGTEVFVSDSNDPVPTIGGGTLITGGPESSAQYEPGIRDRSILDDREDIVRWHSEPLEEDLELVGPISAVVWTSADAVDADVAIHLSAVDPDGTALNIVDGYVRLKYRNGMDHPEPLQPDKPVEATVDLAATGLRISAGWRLRVEIAGTDFPAFDRNPGNGELIADATENDFRPIKQAIHCGEDYPSRLILPILP